MDKEREVAQLKAWILWSALTLTLTLSGVLARVWLADLEGKLRYHLDEIAALRSVGVSNARSISVLEAGRDRADKDRVNLEATVKALCQGATKRVC